MKPRAVVVRLAKYNVYRYIWCITDQSNWSGPFSLVVMIRNPEARGFKSRSGQSTRSFLFTGLFLLLLQLVPGSMMTTV